MYGSRLNVIVDLRDNHDNLEYAELNLSVGVSMAEPPDAPKRPTEYFDGIRWQTQATQTFQ